MLADHAKERLLVLLVLKERSAVCRRRLSRLHVGLAGHDRGDRACVGSALVGVVRQTAAHQERAEVGVAEPEWAEAVAVLIDHRRWVRRVVHEDLLREQGQPRGVLEGLHVELAVWAHELHEVQ